VAFPDAAVAQLLADCKRHCCVCFKWCGTKMHLHHIHARADGGADDIENAIPVCLDCHAEIESRTNMGRQFTRAELHEHKRRWLEICREQPAVLIQANRATAVAGPLEALLSELEFNDILVTGEDHHTDYATPALAQFERAIGANALGSLEVLDREQLFRTYKSAVEVSDLLRSRNGHGPGGNSYNIISGKIGLKRRQLREQLPAAIANLRKVLGANETV